MMTEKMISAVSVSYRDEGNILPLYERLTQTLRKISPDYEIIFVNDASPDRSEEILSDLAAKDRRVTVINHSRNFGAQSAFTSGMEQAVGHAVVIMDGDLQDPPELIEEFVKKWLEGYEVVYGIRRKREASLGRFHAFLYHFFYLIFRKIAFIPIPADTGEFSLMDRKVVDHINALPERSRLIRGLRSWVGFKQAGVSYARPERHWGRSTNSFFRNIRWAKQAIFSFSYVPLEYVSHLAGISTFISLAMMVVYLFLALFFPAPRGFLTLLVVILFLGSVQLLALSFIGEYLQRIFEEVKRRPKYIVKNILNDHKRIDAPATSTDEYTRQTPSARGGDLFR